MITKAGAKAADRLRVLMIEAEVRTLANLDDDERAQFGVLLAEGAGRPGPQLKRWMWTFSTRPIATNAVRMDDPP